MKKQKKTTLERMQLLATDLIGDTALNMNPMELLIANDQWGKENIAVGKVFKIDEFKKYQKIHNTVRQLCK